jgi:ATP-dependent DNA helicase PIF1
LLLEGGRTAHSRFKIPVQGLNETSCCYVFRQSELAELLKAADLIIWDEAPMQHKWVFEAVDRTLRDLTCLDAPFGGKVVLLGGDFRQVLPVVPRAGKAQVVEAALNKSGALWPHVQKMQLHRNMRVERLLQQGGPDAAANARSQQEFADWLKLMPDHNRSLQIG